MRTTPQARVLCSMLNCSQTELIKYNKNVYSWRGIYFEIVGYKSKTAPASHYTTIKTGKRKWSIRELGSKSKLLKNV